MWVSSIIGMALVYLAYVYLVSLKTCDCVNDVYVTRLKNLEAILLGVNAIFFIFAILNSYHVFGALVKFKNYIFKLAMTGGILMTIYYAFFLYNGVEFWRTMAENCACADKWQKYYIYLQTILSALAIVGTVAVSGVLAYGKVPLAAITKMVSPSLKNKGSR
jgi:hypothetical protein